MTLIKSPTELTTSATDLFLAIECSFIAIYLWRASGHDRWRTSLWCMVFGLLSFSSFLGAAAHGLEIKAYMRETLWALLYLSLGISVAFFVIGALFDRYGRGAAKRLVWPGVGTGILFFLLVQLFNGAFIIFVVYEAAAMIFALAAYSFLAFTRRLRGAVLVSCAILMSIIAAAAQASDASITIIFQFDHNGIFHLIQIAAMAVLGTGIWIGKKKEDVS